jgi:multiple sugar transport system ATP-binding protein
MNFIGATVSASGDALWAEARGLRVRVPPHKLERLRAHAGQRVVLGLRPEALRPASASDGDYSFDAAIEVVEPLGSEILLNVRAGDSPVVARVDPGLRFSAHERVRLAFDPARVHFFDAATEASL